MRAIFRISLGALAVSCLSLPYAHAAEAWQEYDQIIKGRQAVGTSGPTLFGDDVNLASGALSFSNVDVSIPGNSALPVAVSRTFSVKSKAGFPDPDRTIDDGHFGDWELDLPNISGVYATDSGWVNARADKRPLRCSVASAGEGGSPSVFVGTTSFPGNDIWHGNRISIPGKGSKALLVARSASPKPSTGGPYVWTTADWTAVSCLPAIRNGSGEGFLAITADGTKYWFDHMSAASAPHLRQKNATRTVVGPSNHSDPNSTGNAAADPSLENPATVSATVGGYDELTRKRYGLYATRVEDRFGNWVTYSYTNGADAPIRLASIQSNDGRRITVAYLQDRVSSVNDGFRTWRYQYSGSSLSSVILPDDSRWTIAFAGLNPQLGYVTGDRGDSWRDCNNPGAVRPTINPTVGTITHPSGATGEFTLAPVRFRRTNVPDQCAIGDPNTSNDDVSYYPNVWDSYALARKRSTGPSLDTADWIYSYDHESAGTTTVTGPGNYAVYTFGRGFRSDEGKLLRVDTGSSAGAIIKSETYSYLPATSAQPYPAPIGDSPQVRSDDFTEEYLRPQVSNTVHQQGATFTASVNLPFDGFARPLSITKGSSLGASKTEATQYSDNPSKWILGQVGRLAVDGVAVAETGYDAATALPIWSRSFGKLQQTFGHNPDGTLRTVTDGRNQTTTLSNWYRGIPQRIQHADGTAESALVNDYAWVVQTTDENGYVANYGYDLMGRLQATVYPTGDAVAYNSTNVEFRPLHSGDYIPAGSAVGLWRQLVVTGNHLKVTFFDALWRPIVFVEYDNANQAGTIRSTRTTYDTNGRVVFQSYPSDTVTPLTTGVRTSYDSLGRVERVVQDSELGPLTSTTEYLPGLQTRTTNPRGLQTSTSYQAFDQPSTDAPVSISHPESVRTYIHRDVFGRPLWIKRYSAVAGQPEAVRRFVYDGADLCKRIEPETGATVMAYDPAGNLSWSAAGLNLLGTASCDAAVAEASGRRISRYYDRRNRLTSMQMPDNNGSQDWTYTPDGLPAQTITYNDGGATAVINRYFYNRRRLLTNEVQEQPNWYSWGIGYGYDANGNLASQSYPTGFSVDYAPNALGQPTRAGPYASGVSYYPNGGIRQFSYGNGIVHTMEQNARQLPAQSVDAGVMHHQYVYDQNSNVQRIYDWRDQRDHRYMDYDGLDRLYQAGSEMFGGDHLHRYSYDALDNLKSATLGGVKDYANYIYDPSNRLTNIKNSAGSSIVGIGYDVQGNLSNKNGQYYSFDYGNRLRTVANSAGTKEAYRYDAQGRRVLAWSPTVGIVLSQYSLGGQLLYQHNDRKGKGIEHVYLGGSLVATLDRNWAAGTTVTRYQHTDALGSPMAVSNEAGQVVERTNYEPYGGAIGKTVDGVGYTGHLMDGETGLTYMQQRYYDPGIGRFLSVDPVTANSNTGGNFNRYWYAAGNPYKFVDPDGREVVVNIERDTYSDNSVTSRITATSDKTDRAFSGYALEDARGGRNRDKDPLQAGSYSGSVRTDGKRGWRIELESKNNYKNVQIHVGNTVKDVEGCFAAGTLRSENFVGGSKKAMNALQSLVKADGSGKIKVNVQGNGTMPKGEFQGVYRVEGRIDSKRLDKELSK